jgi:predicted NACHT family NTPase
VTQHNENQGRDQYIINQPGAVNIHPPAPVPRPDLEKQLLIRVKEEVDIRLGYAQRINLRKQSQPEYVKPKRRFKIKVGNDPPVLSSEDAKIWEIFDHKAIVGKLLILGDPGAGKTTTLMELAEALIARAENQPDHPIPVLFDLASWKDSRQSLKDWMVAELSKYGFKQKRLEIDGLQNVSCCHCWMG